MKLKIKTIVNDIEVLFGVVGIFALNFIFIDVTELITKENFYGKILCSLFFFVVEFFIFGIGVILIHQWVE